LARQTQSYYEILGVNPRATQSEIRSAYVRLMKSHHPDMRRQDGLIHKPDFAPLITRCYGVLKDPAKRAKYDTELARGAAIRRHIPQLHDRRKSPRLPRPSRVGATILVIAVVSVPFLSQLTGKPSAAAPAASSSFYDHTDNGLPPTILISPSMRRQVDLALSVAPHDAERISQSCFQRASQIPSDSAADLCIVFDEAASYLRGLNGDNPDSTYFETEFVRLREDSAMGSFGAAGEARLKQLRRLAFLTLMQEMRARTADVGQTATQDEHPKPADAVSCGPSLCKNGTSSDSTGKKQ